MEGSSMFPVDLKRTDTLGRLPFQGELVDAVCSDILASLLVRAKERREDVLCQISPFGCLAEGSYNPFATLWHPGVSTIDDANGLSLTLYESSISSWLFATETGLTLEDPWLNTDGIRLGVAFIVTMERRPCNPKVFDDGVLEKGLRQIPAGFPVGTQVSFGCDLELEQRRRFGSYASAFIIVPTGLWRTEKDKIGFLRAFHLSPQELDIENGWTISWTGEDPAKLINLHDLARVPATEGDPALVFFLLPRGYVSQEPRNPLSRSWWDLFQKGEIPYGRKNRTEELSSAFNKLSKDIGLWTKLESAEPAEKPDHARYWFGRSDLEIWARM